jgi:hypothetical protein
LKIPAGKVWQRLRTRRTFKEEEKNKKKKKFLEQKYSVNQKILQMKTLTQSIL